MIDSHALAARPASIAVLQLGRLGDTILTTPLFMALREAYSETELVAIVSRDSAVLLEGHPGVDRIVVLPRGYLLVPALLRRLRTTSYDVYIDTKDHRSSTSQLIASWVRATSRIVSPQNAPGRKRWVALPEPRGMHYVDRALAPMSVMEPGREFARRPVLRLPLESLRRVDPQLAPSNDGIATVNISVGDNSRQWGIEKWKEVVVRLSQHWCVTVISSPADRPHADEICSMRREARPVRTETLLDAAVVVSRSRVVITADTSIVHVASAFNTPCVALFPPDPINLARFAPLSTDHRVLQPGSGRALSSITVDAVSEAVGQLIP